MPSARLEPHLRAALRAAASAAPASGRAKSGERDRAGRAAGRGPSSACISRSRAGDAARRAAGGQKVRGRVRRCGADGQPARPAGEPAAGSESRAPEGASVRTPALCEALDEGCGRWCAASLALGVVDVAHDDRVRAPVDEVPADTSQVSHPRAALSPAGIPNSLPSSPRRACTRELLARGAAPPRRDLRRSRSPGITTPVPHTSNVARRAPPGILVSVTRWTRRRCGCCFG